MLAKTPVTQRSPSYSAVSALLTNPLPDHCNHSPLCHTHYQYTSLVSSGQTLYQAASWRLILQSSMLQHFTENLVGNSEKAEQQAEASVDVPYPPLQIVNSVPFCLFSLYLYPLSAPFLNRLSSLSPPSLLSLLIILCLPKIKSSNFITLCFTNGTFFLHSVSHHDIFLIMHSISLSLRPSNCLSLSLLCSVSQSSLP